MTCAEQQREPYRDLFIYYIKGRISGSPIFKDSDFIGNWEEAQDSFLFFRQPADERVRQLLRKQPHLSLQDQFQMSYEQWQGGTLAPCRIGAFHVVPPWHTQAATLTPKTIVLDPGVVFGTGAHPTTSDCLAALQLAFEVQPIATVIDIGTGTGLLALAAACLGAERVLAVDLNLLAVQTAQANVRHNQMTERILVAQGNAMNFMDISSDLMVSNIHYAVMRQLIAEPGFARHRRFILSGLLRSQARDIENQLLRLHVQIEHKWEQQGIWFTFYGRWK
ncbi:MAG: methyltransferase domain-containing protein [Desulfatitalea sp.]|nr:50S ribosomal protein L11 methyltransferase [Desulfatitalea sp.]NNK02871.1 methyltransferase domain-containing protein [Desulfatitalea sp.]